ncbi:hypothetical protein PIB30_054548 [Stylosanthes scabra]|uniref:Uncharacterized protein n=1 Tax=Stylosanthes scabra TaxID=79078 RepID=A0ABU6QKM6_9FABA|nr:hypothetical protein [Stylosanthes scabra]
MAEIAVNLVVDKLIPLLVSEAKLLSGVRGQIESISDDLKLMRAYLRDLDAKAEMEAESSHQNRKEWVNQMRQLSIHIQDVIDLYLYKVATKDDDDDDQNRRRRRGRRNAIVGVLCRICDLLKSCVPRHEIASEIGEIRESINRLTKAAQLYGYSNAAVAAPESSRGWGSQERHYLRLRANFAEEEELVGIEHAKKEIKNWLSQGGGARTVIAVVGEGGLGKTTLVRNVYNQEKHSFDRCAWVDVSRSLKGVQLFKALLQNFLDDKKSSNLDKNLDDLIKDIREHLNEKKYLIVLDDVWEKDLWGAVELALPANANGMIIITTRDSGVADSCKESAKVHTYPLNPLEHEDALRLFYSKAFHSNPPEELMKLSEEFTKKCEGVPLAIVAIASLLSTKKETVSEWQLVYNSLQSKLASDSRLKAIRNQKILVGEEYLAELIARSLVKVAQVDPYDGRVKACRVHDLMHDFILRKCEEFNLCQVKKGTPFCFDKWTRRLSIGTNVDFASLRTSASSTEFDKKQCSLLRSFLLYNIEEETITPFVNSLFSNLKLLVALDCERIPLNHLPEAIGNFLHLKYLNLRGTDIKIIPKSIGKLQNLETLDLKRTNVTDLPVEVYSLTKLCYLNVRTKEWEGVKLEKGIGNLTSLQKLATVDARVDVVGELKKLKQLRSLKITNLVRKDGISLCNAIESMTNLCSLKIRAKHNEILELESLRSPPPHLECLYLFVESSSLLQKVPDWVFRLKNLIKLMSNAFKLTQYQLSLLGHHLPELIVLSVGGPFEGDELNIQKGWFAKLRSLHLWASGLRTISIDEGSLPFLQEFVVENLNRMKPEVVEIPDRVRKVMPLYSCM